jgi:hypothetical protein
VRLAQPRLRLARQHLLVRSVQLGLASQHVSVCAAALQLAEPLTVKAALQRAMQLLFSSFSSRIGAG